MGYQAMPKPTEPITNEEQRRAALIGRKVQGHLMHTRKGYFVRWSGCDGVNSDSIFVGNKIVLRDCGEYTRFGCVADVECTIEKLGPSYVAWNKQHPITSTLELKRDHCTRFSPSPSSTSEPVRRNAPNRFSPKPRSNHSSGRNTPNRFRNPRAPRRL